MKTNFEKFNEKVESVYSSLNKRFIEAKEKASDIDFAEIDFFRVVNLEYTDLQKDFFDWNFFNDITDNKKRNKYYNEAVEYDKLSESDINKYAFIQGYRKYFDERSKLKNNSTTEGQKPIIIWNEKKGQKPVYANFLKLAYGIIYSETYFFVEENKRTEAVEQLAQFFGIKMGKGWNSTLNNVIEKKGAVDIFSELRTNYINNKKPKPKIKFDKKQ